MQFPAQKKNAHSVRLARLHACIAAFPQTLTSPRHVRKLRSHCPTPPHRELNPNFNPTPLPKQPYKHSSTIPSNQHCGFPVNHVPGIILPPLFHPSLSAFGSVRSSFSTISSIDHADTLDARFRQALLRLRQHNRRQPHRVSTSRCRCRCPAAWLRRCPPHSLHLLRGGGSSEEEARCHGL